MNVKNTLSKRTKIWLVCLGENLLRLMAYLDKNILSYSGRSLKPIRTVVFLCVLLCGFATVAQNTNIPIDKQDTIVFRFAPKRLMFWADYKGNAASIDSLMQLVREIKPLIVTGEVELGVMGFCSSYDSLPENLAAAKNRSNQVKSYLIVYEGLKEDHFRTTNVAQMWHGMSDVTALVCLPRNPKPVTPQNVQPEVGAEPADSLCNVVQPSAPEITAAPEQELPPVEPESLHPDLQEELPQSGTIKDEPSQSEMPADSLRPEVVEGLPSVSVQPRYPWAIKTNLLYWAATVANIGVEYSFGDHYSIDLPVVYSPYTVARNYRLRFLVVQPEFRYWLKTPMKGHFFGVHLHAGIFNIAVNDRNRYQSPDGFYGAGLSYGYMLPFSRHWAAEFTIGAGYVYTKYDTFYNISNGARFEKGLTYNYWGLTKAGVSLIYRFGK